MKCFVYGQGRSDPFWTETKEEGMGVRVGKGMGGEEIEQNCGQAVKNKYI